MLALVCTNLRGSVTPDGELWSPLGENGYAFWTRYLDVYTEIRLLVRAVPRDKPPTGWERMTGPRVRGRVIPDFHTPYQLLRSYSVIRRTAMEVSHAQGALLLRAPCILGLVFPRFLRTGRPYGVEVLADPYDVFAPGASNEPLRVIYRRLFSRRLRQQCAGASAAAYVTRDALQRRYPPSAEAVVTHFSDVDLPPEAFRFGPRRFANSKESFTIGFVGHLEQLYKAPDVLIRAASICHRRGANLRIVMVGDGKRRAHLERLARELDIDDLVTFVGRVSPGAGVRALLDRWDLFVLPSRQEGLPRALLEAMARGLPCIGSTVGGMPELLGAQELVPPGDSEALADAMLEVTNDPLRMSRLSAENLDRAQAYRADVLRSRRNEFYRTVATQTKGWTSPHSSTAPTPAGAAEKRCGMK